MKEFRCGLVALSADPITFGHLDLIEKAAERCGKLVVLVAMNERKAGSYVFTLEERTAMTERAVADNGIPNVRVIGSPALLVDVYLREHCDAVFRGTRNENDHDYEETMAELNALILPDLKGRFVYIQSRPEYCNLSSTMVKAFVEGCLDVNRFVPMFVKQRLEEKILGQYRLGVTGSIAVGKSWVADSLVKIARERKMDASHLNVDALLRRLYEEDSEGAQDVRERIAERLGDGMLVASRKAVDRKALAATLFDGQDADEDRAFIVGLTMPHVQRLYREELRGQRGLIVVEWAQMAEMGMGFWTNHNVVVVESPDREGFAEKRGLGVERLEALSHLQLPAGRKADVLEAAAVVHRSGMVCRFENRFERDSYKAKVRVESLLDSLLSAAFPSLKT